MLLKLSTLIIARNISFVLGEKKVKIIRHIN